MLTLKRFSLWLSLLSFTMSFAGPVMALDIAGDSAEVVTDQNIYARSNSVYVTLMYNNRGDDQQPFFTEDADIRLYITPVVNGQITGSNIFSATLRPIDGLPGASTDVRQHSRAVIATTVIPGYTLPAGVYKVSVVLIVYSGDHSTRLLQSIPTTIIRVR